LVTLKNYVVVKGFWEFEFGFDVFEFGFDVFEFRI